MVRIALCALALLVAVPAGAEEAAKAPKKKEKSKKKQKITEMPEFREKLYQQIKATTPRVDRCTQKYVTDYPGREGFVVLAYTIEPNGRVKKTDLQTSLKNFDHLWSCLKDVARQWRFPPVGDAQVTSTLRIKVAKGVRFDVLKPGEKRKVDTSAAPGASKEEQPVMRFTGGEPEGNNDGVDYGAE